jgi:hypothetical protein
MPIADWQLPIANFIGTSFTIGNRQSAIGNKHD